MLLKEIAYIRHGLYLREKRKASGRYLRLGDVEVEGTPAINEKSLQHVELALENGAALTSADVLFAAKGSQNLAFHFTDIPENIIPASIFIIIRIQDKRFLPGFIAWYLNNHGIRNLEKQFSGRMVVYRKDDLEKLNVPAIPLEIQQKLLDIEELLLKEQSLSKQIIEKKQLLLNQYFKNTYLNE